MKSSLVPEDIEAAPARLMETEDALGALLREEVSAPLERSRPFFQVLDVYRRRRIVRPLLAGVFSLAAASLLWVYMPRVETFPIAAENPGGGWGVQLSRQGAQEAEPIREASAHGESSDLSTGEEESAGEQAARPVEKGRKVAFLLAGGKMKAPQSKNSVEPGAQAETFAGSEAEQVEVDCAALGRGAQYAQALDCYGRKAEGAGMGAELALLEAARLQRRALSRNDQALATLNRYRARFPQGMLRREAELLRLELLTALGQTKQARQAIEGLLAIVPEMKSSLLRRGFDLAWSERDCEGARVYQERLREAGLASEDLAERLASCVSGL